MKMMSLDWHGSGAPRIEAQSHTGYESSLAVAVGDGKVMVSTLSG